MCYLFKTVNSSVVNFSALVFKFISHPWKVFSTVSDYCSVENSISVKSGSEFT